MGTMDKTKNTEFGNSKSGTTAAGISNSKHRNRDRIVKNIKTGGSMVMYIGSAGLMTPVIRNSQQNQNGAMNICSFGAGAVLSMGLGAVASKMFGKLVDKALDFWDDVKPKHDDEKDDEHEYTRY